MPAFQLAIFDGPSMSCLTIAWITKLVVGKGGRLLHRLILTPFGGGRCGGWLRCHGGLCWSSNVLIISCTWTWTTGQAQHVCATKRKDHHEQQTILSNPIATPKRSMSATKRKDHHEQQTILTNPIATTSLQPLGVQLAFSFRHL